MTTLGVPSVTSLSSSGKLFILEFLCDFSYRPRTFSGTRLALLHSDRVILVVSRDVTKVVD